MSSGGSERKRSVPNRADRMPPEDVMNADHYAALGFWDDESSPERASTSIQQEDIRDAYRTLMKRFHPDTSGLPGDYVRRIKEAFDALNDQKSREEYDRQRLATNKKQHRPPSDGLEGRGGSMLADAHGLVVYEEGKEAKPTGKPHHVPNDSGGTAVYGSGPVKVLTLPPPTKYSQRSRRLEFTLEGGIEERRRFNAHGLNFKTQVAGTGLLGRSGSSLGSSLVWKMGVGESSKTVIDISTQVVAVQLRFGPEPGADTPAILYAVSATARSVAPNGPNAQKSTTGTHVLAADRIVVRADEGWMLDEISLWCESSQQEVRILDGEVYRA